MPNRFRTCALIVLLIVQQALVIGIPGSAHAFERKSWLSVTGMLSRYEMADVNSGIQELGQALLGGVFVDDVPVGLGFGFGLGMDVSRLVAVGLDYDRFIARTSGEGTNSDLPIGRVEIAMSLPANAVSGSVEFRHHGGRGVDIPAESRWSVGAGIGGGVIWTSSELKVTTDDDVDTTTLTGSGPLLEGFLAADIWQSPRLGFTSSLGYRYAKIDSPEITTSGTLVPTDAILSIDYSGLYIQVGIKFALH